ncbi:MAG TPA: SdrD B-like domain-containing protein, partial [Anaerolineales bacterium]|nr:SdrD B-like domain-containing protein [Anaerolineales bacterium]
DSCANHTEVFFDSASLIEVGGSTAPTTAPGQQPTQTLPLAPTNFPTPTPNSEGKIVYTVQVGDSIIHLCEVVGRGTEPACIDDIVKWNGLSSPRAISPGQQLIIAQSAGGAPPPTVAPTETPAVQLTADPNAQPTADPNTQPTTDPNAPTPDPNALPTAAQLQTTAGGAAAICVTLYNDANGNGLLDQSEGLVTGGNFSLLDIGNSNTVATYTTTGITEPHCFENLPAGNYRINSAVPENYKATTRTDWDLTLAAGSTANIEFGAQSTGETAASDGGDGNSGATSAVLIRTLLAAAGVVLLLIAAGVAGFLVLTRRR